MATKNLRAAILGVLTTLVVVGCSGAHAPATSSVSGASDAAVRLQAATQQDVTPEEVISDIDMAVEVTDGFWRAHWSEIFTGSYQAPGVLGLYDGTDPSTAPVCNLPSGEVQVLLPMNAYFCPDVSGEFVAWDAGFMSKAFEIGDTFVYLIVAHEWGHAIAFQLNADSQSVAGELQADCFAGAALYGAVRDGTLILEEGDEREITNGLTDIADETEWTDVQDHGDPFQRIEAFNLGRTQGPAACLPSA